MKLEISLEITLAVDLEEEYSNSFGCLSKARLEDAKSAFKLVLLHYHNSHDNITIWSIY
jgi:hypothetical protein